MGIDARSLHTAGILALADHDIRLLIPDLRGHGKSPRANAEEFSHATWVTDVRELVSRLGLSRLRYSGTPMEVFSRLNTPFAGLTR